MRRGVVFGGLITVSTAVAAFCCDPWGLPGAQAFIQAGAAMSAAVTASSSTIMSYLNLNIGPHFEQGVGQLLIERSKQTAEQRTISEGAIATQQTYEAQALVGESQEQAKPAAQQDTTVTNAMLSNELDPIVTDKVKALDLAWSNAFISPRALDVSLAVIARHVPFCAPSDVEAGYCKEAAIPSLQNADLTINSIYQPGDGQYDTLSDQEHDAAVAFVTNITQPAPYMPPSKQVGGSQAALSAELVKEQAALALVAHSFNEQIALRTRRHAE